MGGDDLLARHILSEVERSIEEAFALMTDMSVIAVVRIRQLKATCSH